MSRPLLDFMRDAAGSIRQQANEHREVKGWQDFAEDATDALATVESITRALGLFEAWWQEVGQVSFNGAPACVFALREAAAKARGGS